MTEIDGKKYYTWDEIRAMPLGTKFTFGFIYDVFHLERTPKGKIVIISTSSSGDGLSVGELTDVNMRASFAFQDRFELVEDPKPGREYVDGPDALRKLMNGEWEYIVCDHADWGSSYVTFSAFDRYIVSENTIISEALSEKFLKLKRWYEYKDES